MEKGSAMGEIVVDIELENPRDRALFEEGHRREEDIRRVTVRAVADTGAVMLALPEDTVNRLGIRVVGSAAFTYADGQQRQRPIAGPLTVRIGDRWTSTECVVVPAGADALVGQIVMERLDLVADCVRQTLGPRPESPDRPLLRL